jgi:hypothetical protein
MPELLVAMLFAIVLLNVWATWRVVYDDLSSSLQKIALVTLTWVLPVLGALLVLHMQRKHPERGSGRYPAELDTPDDFGHPRRPLRTKEATEGDGIGADGGGSDD